MVTGFKFNGKGISLKTNNLVQVYLLVNMLT